MPDPSPSRKEKSTGWDSEKTAPKKESADEKLRRLQMQMASGSRAGVKQATPDPAAEAPRKKTGELLIIAFASIALLGGLVFAVVAVVDKPDPSTANQPPAVLPPEPDQPGEDDSASTQEPDHRWIKSDSEEAEPYTTLLNQFFSADGEAKRAFFEPTPELEERMDTYSGHELLAPLPEQRYAKNVFISGDGIVSIDTNITGHGFRPIVLLPAPDGAMKIDFDSFIGHNEYDWDALVGEVEEHGSLKLRVLLKIDRNMTAKVPGDVILEFRNPALENTYHAHLSILDVPQKHIVKWLNAGVPLPFTITLTQEDSLYGKILRVPKIEANAWLIDNRGRSLEIAP